MNIANHLWGFEEDFGRPKGIVEVRAAPFEFGRHRAVEEDQGLVLEQGCDEVRHVHWTFKLA